MPANRLIPAKLMTWWLWAEASAALRLRIFFANLRGRRRESSSLKIMMTSEDMRNATNSAPRDACSWDTAELTRSKARLPYSAVSKALITELGIDVSLYPRYVAQDLYQSFGPKPQHFLRQGNFRRGQVGSRSRPRWARGIDGMLPAGRFCPLEGVSGQRAIVGRRQTRYPAALCREEGLFSGPDVGGKKSPPGAHELREISYRHCRSLRRISSSLPGRTATVVRSRHRRSFRAGRMGPRLSWLCRA